MTVTEYTVNISSRSSRPEVFSRKGVLRTFAKFAGKHFYQSLFIKPLTTKGHWWPKELSTTLWHDYVNKGTTNTKELKTNKKRKKQKKVPRSHGNARFLHILKRTVFLRAKLPTKLTKVLQFSIFMNKFLILMSWLRYLFNKATSIPNKIGGSFSPMTWKLNWPLVSITSWL